MTLMGDANWWLSGWFDRLLSTIDIGGERNLPAVDQVTESVSPADSDFEEVLVGE